jgi:hypothetical protein
MTRRAWLARLAPAGALGLLLAAEWLLPGPAAPPAREALAVPAGAPDPAGDAAIQQWGATILARPLFNSDRRPVPPAGTVVDNTLPRLSAVIVIGGIRRAVFAAPGQKPQLLVEGQTIGPYKVEAIAPDKVRLLGPDGPMTLHPQFMTATPTAMANNN